MPLFWKKGKTSGNWVILRTTKEGDYGKEKHFRDVVAAVKHLRNQHAEESSLRVYILEPDKLGFDS